MAESFLFNIAESVLSKIDSLALEETACAAKDDLRKLQNTLSTVKALLLDAEEKHRTSLEIATWLGQLHDVLSEAEDVFDEFDYEALRKQVDNTRGGVGKKVRRFVSSSNPIAFRRKMGQKVKEISEAFDEVAANKAKFCLNPRVVSNNRPLMLTEREMTTHCFVNASNIIGRDRERDAIVNSLMDPFQDPEENLAVVSVVGFGGFGKTALAKMVFNDSRIVEHFKKRVWVCLGALNEFDVYQVMIRIVKAITGEKSFDSDPEHLQRCLSDSLREKRFILVLDDVHVIDHPKWLELKRSLMSGSGGSKVVVTTRNSLVASCMGSIFTQNLECLPHGECVSLFKRFAFNEEEDHQNLMKIGDDIVRKCKGVPLVIKTLGGMLFLKRSVGDWILVRDSEIWKLEQNKDDILPALKLSYNQLPFVLKQCFIYCSVFPKNFKFLDVELVQHWSVYGLLHSPFKTKKPEDIGQQYIKELMVRGFFQDFEDFSTISNFKMHDLIHDLAMSVAQNEFRNMNMGILDQDIYNRIKHVSFSREEGLVGEEVPKSFLKNSSSVRGVMPTIWCMCFDGKGGGARIGKLVKICISKLKYLRILDFSNTSLKHLPNSIGTLKHVRSLNLKGCKRLKRLPSSITKLYNLQTLSLEGCEELKELPKDIGDLINLRQLAITTKQKRLSAATENGIKSLCSLHYLLFDNCQNLEYLFELENDGDDEARQQLTSLRILVISECKSLMFLFPPSTSREKRSRVDTLETLGISGCQNFSLASASNDEISTSLKSLILDNLPQMESLPQWICPCSLESLAISDCPNLTSLPEWLQSLNSLRKLKIQNCPKLLCLPEGIRCLAALLELVIEDCPELCRRCKNGNGDDWHKIAHIPNLRVEEYESKADEDSEDEGDKLEVVASMS